MEIVITILQLRYSWPFELKIPLKRTEYSVKDASVVPYSLFSPVVINTFPYNCNIIFSIGMLVLALGLLILVYSRSGLI